jgi:PIN domain nuclease of toxin-antitoxin system
VNLLLDSVALLFWVTNDARLGTEARRLIDSVDDESWVSIASLWEIAIKAGLTRSTVSLELLQNVRGFVGSGACQVLPITERHAFHVASLPLHHRDPFDRLLIAQSQLEGMPILTNDAAFQRYDADIRW